MTNESSMKLIQQEKKSFDSKFSMLVKHRFNERNPLSPIVSYSLFGTAKRIRPLLCLSFMRALGGNPETAFLCASAIEFIHTYSLIHDDLPAMDNDDFRRGRPTSHKKFSEADAILAGDALLNEAPLLLLESLPKAGLSAELTLNLTSKLLTASGHRGMIHGQKLDLEAQGHQYKNESIEKQGRKLKAIHQLKTGNLIAWSCVAGLYSTHDKLKIEQLLPNVQEFGDTLGQLFQLIDDILDETADREQIGKTPGKDILNGKLTYISLYGPSRAREIASELIQSSYILLEAISKESEWRETKEIIVFLEKSFS